MKKLICSIVCFCTVLSFIGCNSQSDNSIHNKADVSGKLSDAVEFSVHDDNANIWLNNAHIEKVSVEMDDEGKKTLIFTTTEEGKTVLFNATKENISKPLSVSANQHLLFSQMVVAPIEDGVFACNSTLVDPVYLYNYLTDAKDKMQGVTPPQNLISEDAAKNTVFDRADITADNVSDLEIELKIDEDYFGWKYCIRFVANNKEYTSEVNAHVGNIAKFVG